MQTIETGNGARSFVPTGLMARDVPFHEIPVVDFAAMPDGSEAERRQAAEMLRHACVNIGFFYVRNHGVPSDVIQGAFAQAHRFFGLPDAEKRRIHIGKSKNHRGYVPLLEENTDPTARGDLHEAFDMALEVPADDPDVLAGKSMYGANVWPEDLPGFREALDRYYWAMYGFGRNIFRAFALALELPELYFDPLITKPTAQLRLLHYPSQEGEVDDRQIGIGAHSDYECFTILAQDEVAALQVLNSAGQWISAPPIPGTFVVNVADQMARWTNDYFASTVHRAINRSGRERYSIPYFFGPNFDTMVEVLPSCCGPGRPAKYPPVRSGDYILGRFDDTFSYRAKADGAEATV